MNIQPMDWSATAAWVAVVISIISASIGPLLTAHLNNKHQLKLREMDAKEKQLSEYYNHRRHAIENFLSSTSKCLLDFHSENMDACGEYFFQVYPYVPQESWGSLNKLYEHLCNTDVCESRALFLGISKQLIEILEETPQLYP